MVPFLKKEDVQMKLVIAEKPSVAQSLARVIGADKRQDGYLEGGGYLVSWCVGHLVELSAPERYDKSFAKWRLEDLPILPERWLYEVKTGANIAIKGKDQKCFVRLSSLPEGYREEDIRVILSGKVAVKDRSFARKPESEG